MSGFDRMTTRKGLKLAIRGKEDEMKSQQRPIDQEAHSLL